MTGPPEFNAKSFTGGGIHMQDQDSHKAVGANISNFATPQAVFSTGNYVKDSRSSQ
ncbi:hypothetical protein BGX31_001461 [Mortierella sp. GBA43]|nr:hypothetical protein BGX31_001461 [Mortierella sp. GBA43]